MRRFNKLLAERIHTAKNDSKLVEPEVAYKQATGSLSYKVINQDRVIVLTTDGIGNTKYTFRKELVARLRQLAYTKHPKHDFTLSKAIDHSKDKKWTFLINNKPIATGSPKDLIQFLLTGPIREDVEEDDEKEDVNREREDKPRQFVIVDKTTGRVHSKHRSRADVDVVLNKMSIEDRKEYKVQLEEAAYKGNIGFEELYQFHQAASTKEKGELDKLIRSKKFKEAWTLVKKVTKSNLVGLGEETNP